MNSNELTPQAQVRVARQCAMTALAHGDVDHAVRMMREAVRLQQAMLEETARKLELAAERLML